MPIILAMIVILILFTYYVTKAAELREKSRKIVDEAIEQYPELINMIRLRPSFYDELIDDIDTLLPAAIDVIIEHRLSN